MADEPGPESSAAGPLAPTPAAIARTLWRGRGLIAVSAAGLFAAVGYLSAMNLARPLGISVADLGFDRAAYVLFISASVTFGLLWMLVIVASAFLAGVAMDELMPSLRVRFSVLVVAGALVWIGAYEADRWLAGWAFVAVSLAGSAALGGALGITATLPGDDVRLRRSLIGIVLGVLTLGYPFFALNRVSLEGRDLAEYAIGIATEQPRDRPTTPLSLITEPTRGVLDAGDIREMCVVRITDRVYLIAASEPDAVRTLIVAPDRFVADDTC